MKSDKIIDRKRVDVFWGEMAACEHFVQIYDHEDVFIDTLEGFIRGGLEVGDTAIVIATPLHLRALEDKMRRNGVDPEDARIKNHYIALDAEEMLRKFMVNGWPDDLLFTEVVTEVIERAKSNGRNVRAFGEMVALLWAQGHNGAVVRLEHLWTNLCNNQSFSLFCAYPRAGFTQNANISILQVCAAHSKVIST